MLRIALVVAMLAVTIYAAADWHRTPEDEMPGKIAKPIWLMIILFTATIAAIGPIAWLVLRWVSRAEKAQQKQAEAPKRPSAPDDDPEFLFRLERDIQRKRRERACDLKAAENLIDPVILRRAAAFYPDNLSALAYELDVTDELLAIYLDAHPFTAAHA